MGHILQKDYVNTDHGYLPAIAGSSEQRFPLSVDTPGISTTSGKSLPGAPKTAHEMYLTEKMVLPRKSPNSQLSKTICSFFASSLWRETERQGPI